jgi:hypothetical protein
LSPKLLTDGNPIGLAANEHGNREVRFLMIFFIFMGQAGILGHWKSAEYEMP